MLTLANEKKRRIRAKNSFTKYCEYVAPDEPPAAHHRILCEAFQEIVEGENDRLLVLMPPGSAKSTYATIRGPAYYLGRNPGKSVICGSYSADLSESFGKKCRNLIQGDEHQSLFPASTLSDDTKAKGEWETQKGGGYKSCGVDGSITGRRGDLLIIDDPVKGRKESDSEVVKDTAWNWFKSDFLSRGKLGEPVAILVIQTRWVEDDISGRILPEDWDGESGYFEGFDGKQWKVISIQAQAEEGKNDPLGREPGEWLWPEQITPEQWETIKTTQTHSDMRNWGSLYQQNPTPDEGTHFKKHWFNRYRVAPDELNIYVTHDDAVTEDQTQKTDPDYTEIALWGVDIHDNIYALAWWYGQTEIDEWIDVLFEFNQFSPFAVVGEQGIIRRASEPFILKEMTKRKQYFRLEWLPHVGDKLAKCRSFQALAKVGKVYFPYTDWAERVIKQLIGYPGAKYDDAFDTCGLIGRTIHQTWAPDKIEPKKKLPVDAQPTVSELFKLDQVKKKPKYERI